MALSKTQNKRLGSILGVMFNDSLSEEILNSLTNEGYIKLEDSKYVLTDKGLDEKQRLCTLSGLNIMYSSEKKKEIS
jgi:Mn-dependent DtxR family transcriptional regulator|tara:strand:+ start:329 stop:559 length:231 start_codon:yes stop_codon:yes gene_type:complete